jgi:DNA-binding LytR/AlgR family response regulator
MEKIAICDDDPNSIKALREQIKKFARNMGIEVGIVEYSSGTNLLFDWEDTKRQADILYLDIHMPEITGIEVAEKLRREGCNTEIIFYTGSPPEVFDAFDVDAFHYILKGKTSIEKQEDIFCRAVDKLYGQDDEFITFSCGGEHKTIKINSIKYFIVKLKIITVYYEGNKTFDFYSNLSKTSNALLNEGFIRINRETLINMEEVKDRTRVEVVMKDEKSFPIGRRYREIVDRELEYYYK